MQNPVKHATWSCLQTQLMILNPSKTLVKKLHTFLRLRILKLSVQIKYFALCTFVTFVFICFYKLLSFLRLCYLYTIYLYTYVLDICYHNGHITHLQSLALLCFILYSLLVHSLLKYHWVVMGTFFGYFRIFCVDYRLFILLEVTEYFFYFACSK